MKKIAKKISIVITLTAFFIIAGLQIHNLLTFPITRGFDATGHIAYINFLKIAKRVPLPNEGWEMWQPPLYYLLSSFFPTLQSIRFLHGFLWIILFLTGFVFLDKFIKNKAVTLLALLTIVTLPVVIYSTPALSNEFFSGVMISLTLVYYCLTKESETLKTKLILGLLLSASILSKATAWVLVAAILIDVFIKSKKSVAQTVQKLAVPLLVMIVIGGWFYIRNIVLFGNPLIASVDFPQYAFSQPPGYRDLKFFTDLSAFLKFDLFHAHFYSLWAGTYFSWFYDGHNVIIPVQPFSKAGVLLIIMSLPLTALFLIGLIREWRSPKKNLILIVYPLLLFLSYVLYNFKLPFYSTVKATFIISAVIPFGYFLARGMELYRKYLLLFSLYMFLYCLLIVKNFWILSWWYK